MAGNPDDEDVIDEEDCAEDEYDVDGAIDPSDDFFDTFFGSGSTMYDFVISRIKLNLLRTWKPTFTEDNYLMELAYRAGDLHGEWVQRYNELRAAYIEEQGKESGKYITPHKFLDDSHINEFVKSIEAEHPYLVEGDWKIGDNAKVLAEMLDLDRVETLLLDLSIRNTIGISYECRNAISKYNYCDEAKDPVRFYSRIFELQEADVKKALDGFLFKSGLLVPDHGLKMLHQINEEMADAFTEQTLTVDTLESKLFPSNMNTELTVDHYPHFSKEIKRTEDIIGKSLEADTRGINVMFWGIPGTGKTELALAMAKKNGWKLKIIGDVSDTDGQEKSRAQRLTSLKIAMKLYAKEKDVVLLFDEMEDLFKHDANATFSKAFINRIIETTPIPIIWTTNALMVMGSAVLRRMVYNIGFEVPPVSARKLIWENYTKKYGVELDEQTIDDLANAFDTVPALINNAVRISSLAGLEKTEIREVLTSLDRLMNYGEERKFEFSTMKETPYDASCANTDINLEELTERLMRAKPAFTMCLYGAPGTGKSEYGRYLAKRLGKKVLFKRASDLQSMWVGQTEKNIARAFKEASEEEKVLIIDEGDSFLQDRTRARASWEVSQVNEMLSQMEVHDQPFIITTNLMDNLDPASLRRFTFKMKFDFMKPEQARRLFKSYFGVEAPERINRNEIITPGDYAAVRKKVEILGITDAEEIYKMIEEETNLKPQRPGNPLGFH